jgi:hypothetical protein
LLNELFVEKITAAKDGHLSILDSWDDVFGILVETNLVELFYERFYKDSGLYKLQCSLLE